MTQLIFTPDGAGHALYTEAIDLSRIGTLTVQRATHIAFDNRAQYWRVYEHTGFPMFNSPSRQACLDWEQRYLEAQEANKHELPTDAGAVAAGAGIDGSEAPDAG